MGVPTITGLSVN
uniref:Uncharacterized protein n=1 Tax=Anguilla anguilla TaxID=7936 RepID=A0A0E9VNH2_ANGAN